MAQDIIFLKDLEIDCIIGMNDWERMVKQTVRISYEVPTNIREAARTKDVRKSVNYKSVSKWMIDFVEASDYLLIETLAEELATECIKQFKLSEIKLTVEKPGAIRHSRSVGVTITRSLDDV